MNPTPLARLLSSTDPESLLYTYVLPDEAQMYTVRGGEIYHHKFDARGHGFMFPQFSSRSLWVRVAQVCAFTAPANPQHLALGAAGERLGAFWRGLASVDAEQRVSVSQLLSVALPALALAQ